MELSRGLIKADIFAAEQALDEFRKDKSFKDIKNVCAYHLQQAAEKLIKIQVYESGVQYDNKSMYTHNITDLLVYVKKIGIDINVPKYILDNSSVITKWETGSRYDIHFMIRSDSLGRCLSEIKDWYSSV